MMSLRRPGRCRRGARASSSCPISPASARRIPIRSARGAFVGLTVRHTQPHMTRAVLEGVAFGLRDSMELIRGAGPVTQVRVAGGGAKSALWRQILADVMDAELVTVNTTEGAAYGAALLAGVGAGRWASVAESCAATVRPVERTAPISANVAIYERAYAQYRALYPALKPIFHAIGEA